MIAMTLAEVAAAVGGEVAGPPGLTVTGEAFLDSRDPVPGGLFVAVAGDHADGHDFAEGAVAGGAAAVLGSRALSAPTVVVDDVVAALGRLARHLLDRLPDLTVLALTGSQGKTGTKDYLAQVLATAGPPERQALDRHGRAALAHRQRAGDGGPDPQLDVRRRDALNFTPSRTN